MVEHPADHEVHKRVGVEESGEQNAELRIIQLQFSTDQRGCHAQRLAVEVAERSGEQQKQADFPRPPAGLCGGRGSLLCYRFMSHGSWWYTWAEPNLV